MFTKYLDHSQIGGATPPTWYCYPLRMAYFDIMSRKQSITETEFNSIIDEAVKIYRRPDVMDKYSLQQVIKIGGEEYFSE